ncbi:recombinase family protein [Clostridium butyricum]|uniref:Transposon resolvase n=1 Tax=Clostridium butyricum E4 str. BoNT E BL5262 TaxID=632245 RepID=C4IHB2_CLOBU|nr:recombinase family protein [Clostridium butyricum]EDT75437.1 transposon resolvase [Clostridium butyricum 5521]EEP53009.1 transposon resolvase [Clostridium butyricum E4 str. BoNT E BL5262]NFL30254.1 recombinase family protein [Clostridium butyricum]NFS17644.1 recombinase family protein [Clostridium butyricum]
MRVGYIRVSTVEQNTARQEVLMQELDVDKVYIEKVSGKNVNDRLKLQEMLEFIREGDIVVVESISRLARNTKDLLEIVEKLKNKGVVFISKKENIDTDTPSGQFMLTIFGAVAQLERDYILQRQREGIAIAKQEGKYKGRKPIEFDKDKFNILYERWKKEDITATEFMKQINLKPTTFYRKVRQYEK